MSIDGTIARRHGDDANAFVNRATCHWSGARIAERVSTLHGELEPGGGDSQGDKYANTQRGAASECHGYCTMFGLIKDGIL